MTVPDISVVVPYFERQDQLDRLLAGLDRQSLPAEAFELVVADDGSRQAPSIGPRRYPTRVVRQEDSGFRLAQARNLGAAASTGRVIAFVDQDCVPGPDYLRLVRQAASSPWSLVVGHRVHAALTGWPEPALSAWLSGDGPPPPSLPEPLWLLRRYARTEALTKPDDHAYQLVIGAALSLHRELFAHLGGFDPTFRAYGGEDWDLGHRAYVAGADLRWQADAVVWHDGPDFGGRPVDLVGMKNDETFVLARRVPDPDVRGTHLVWRVPRIVVRLRACDAPRALLVAAIESLLAGADAHVWVEDGDAGTDLVSVLEDPRVHLGSPPADVMARSAYTTQCDPVVLLGGTLHDLEASTPIEGPGFRMISIRDENRSRRGVPAPPAGPWPDGVQLEPLPRGLQLERHWQQLRLRADDRRPASLSTPTSPGDLATTMP
ncbi:MAG: glycosyltransferase [Lapillicoccus sp.]